MSLKINDYLISEEMIELCYSLAEKALSIGEVPVGCVFVHFKDSKNCGEVVVSGHNRTNESRNATRHAEIECIDEIVHRFGHSFDQLIELMSKTTVLLTLEPCLMCVRALRALRVSQVLFGAKNERFGGSQSVYNICDNHFINEPILKCYDVLDFDKSIKLLKMFYQQNNESAQKVKPKKLKTK